MGDDEFKAHTGTLVEMFQQGYSEAESKALSPQSWSSGQFISSWFEYAGPDCSPFKAYMRYGKDLIVIANIIGGGRRDEESTIRKGRMPKVVAACFEVAPRLRVESVLSPHLRDWLIANDFKPIDESWPTYEKSRE